ncbi:hypothetical protein TorRG33x02_104270 [Trema orientale]|uniref:RNase H type-1 domain-containing protein n=1 Tax=Trema orientale TaxID=63057 RepID=A0A2P5F7F4_TREOI|nr:hypothetical protein TorRG33x02_104270 [Trema orientale]
MERVLLALPNITTGNKDWVGCGVRHFISGRNQVAHGGTLKQADLMISFAESLIMEFNNSRDHSLSPQLSTLPLETCWSVPPNNQLKLKTDAAVKVGDGFIRIGAVIRDHNGQVLVALSKRISGGMSVEAAELMAPP